ncbi:F-box/LRR-repeat protein 15-like [Limulus polyphemus]|uniref:F-box/LRR-repeat protein 15-like n=1 Tax=Limulus polyphemus TaxID=6850 RepID=A0ABM1SXN4_LIMPO|nr:F-box/LRR-repeat protein 15-like [Limulus polyphemus]XP_022248390.1 F-box/LRR-repeat protein 15-like [Limulus polyphemus]XP_022248391.1 F-box/LRR-repeat protein 15-like [Limulus polyphemus]XP_022248392.1 F-box/LRR-repeat protein 15-like [Limulus polyphemus]XP_022248393.1 F-box/LRR-repeat protein 15-like [Limulus polyphemus]
MDETGDFRDSITLLNIPWNDVLFVYLIPNLSWADLFRLRRVSSEFKTLVCEYLKVCRKVDISFYNSYFSSDAFKIIINDAFFIHDLILKNCKWLTNDLLCPVFDRNPNILKVDISGCSAVSNPSLQILAVCCPALKYLSLEGCHWVSAAAVESLALHCPGLEVVNLTSCWEVTDQAASTLAACCTRLRSLSLSRIYGITDKTLSMIAGHSSLLEHLDVAGCWRVTDHGIRLVGEYCRILKSLKVQDCRDVTEGSLATLRLRIEVDRPKNPYSYNVVPVYMLRLQI